MKYLLLLAFLAAVWWLWSKRQGFGERDAPVRKDPAPEKMLTCAHCGLHLPESDALTDGDKVYCCDAHRKAAATLEQ